MTIRAAELRDATSILDVIRDAITANVGQRYSADQTRVWVSGFSEESIVLAIRYTDAIVAEIGGKVVGFGNIEISDESTARVHLLYVSSQCQRQGIGALMIEVLEARAKAAARARVEADASLLAHGLFLKMGYSVREQYTKTHHGFQFPNAWVEKNL